MKWYSFFDFVWLMFLVPQQAFNNLVRNEQNEIDDDQLDAVHWNMFVDNWDDDDNPIDLI